MSDEPIHIKRYPNRRFYASHTSKYVSLPDIEQMIRDGATVEIIDSQTGQDLTGTVLMQILAEMHPDKLRMFPSAMLHSIVRANDVMAQFLRDYFVNSLAYLEYLQKHGTSASIDQPMHWMAAWLDQWSQPTNANCAPEGPDKSTASNDHDVSERIARLEQRIADLEKQKE